MRKWLLVVLVAVLVCGVAPVEARNSLGLSMNSNGIYPIGLIGVDNGFAVGLEADPALSYIGFVGRHYEYSDYMGGFGGFVIGSVASYGISLVRLQGGYSFRLDKSIRGSLGISLDSGPNSYSGMGILAELHFLF